MLISVCPYLSRKETQRATQENTVNIYCERKDGHNNLCT